MRTAASTPGRIEGAANSPCAQKFSRSFLHKNTLSITHLVITPHFWPTNASIQKRLEKVEAKASRSFRSVRLMYMRITFAKGLRASVNVWRRLIELRFCTGIAPAPKKAPNTSAQCQKCKVSSALLLVRTVIHVCVAHCVKFESNSFWPIHISFLSVPLNATSRSLNMLLPSTPKPRLRNASLVKHTSKLPACICTEVCTQHVRRTCSVRTAWFVKYTPLIIHYKYCHAVIWYHIAHL